ncbi:MAG: hypothetical protein JWQ14_2682 [Adhaeribacter sp.]|jgi:hypothetical protein|nr:hypothetical protein [Adhaeribacter sp.]
MDITKEDFDDKFRQTLDTIIVAMAEHPGVNPEKFYSMTCVLENLAFFSPVIYGALQKKDNNPD